MCLITFSQVTTKLELPRFLVFGLSQQPVPVEEMRPHKLLGSQFLLEYLAVTNKTEPQERKGKQGFAGTGLLPKQSALNASDKTGAGISPDRCICQEMLTLQN